MKGRILFALMFAALMALGISSLNDLQAQKAALPPMERAAVYLTALPPQADPAEDAAALFAKAPPAQQHFSAPQITFLRHTQAPQVLQSYYLAYYQAFHYSDCAG